MQAGQLYELIRQQRSYLCVGLDSDPDRIPEHLQGEPDPVLAFNQAIIRATADYCVAYKPNTAFYESRGAQGWSCLEQTISACRQAERFCIADAKRGDIGNTSRQYAKAFFELLGADALTVAPYMGSDSVVPFLEYPGKWVALLLLTSNPGSADFQMGGEQGESLHEKVLRISQQWPGSERLMYVVGATHPGHFSRLRRLAPDAFFLVPGIGAQGGDLQALSRAGFNSQCGLLVNASRSILYAGSGPDFADAAREEARNLQMQMEALLGEAGLL
jgi:orotidine-5'-phosphate decarboxylase